MRSQHFIHTILFLAILLSVLSCEKADERRRSKDALACVNQECLTEKDIEYQLGEAYPAFSLEQKKEFIRGWIKQEIFYQEAKRLKLDQEERVKSLIKQVIKDMVVSEFLEQKLKDKINVTEEEAREHFRENQQMYMWEEDYVRIRHIFTEGMAQATLAGLLLKEGNKFEDVVQRTSQDIETKERGGDLGFVRIRDLSPEVAQYAHRLTIGETSPPIATPYGYEIIRVIDRRHKGTPKGFEWVKDEIVNALSFQKEQREIENILESLLDEVDIQTFDWASDISLDQIR
jgi:foldase protein PrsA